MFQDPFNIATLIGEKRTWLFRGFTSTANLDSWGGSSIRHRQSRGLPRLRAMLHNSGKVPDKVLRPPRSSLSWAHGILRSPCGSPDPSLLNPGPQALLLLPHNQNLDDRFYDEEGPIAFFSQAEHSQALLLTSHSFLPWPLRWLK